MDDVRKPFRELSDFNAEAILLNLEGDFALHPSPETDLRHAN